MQPAATKIELKNRFASKTVSDDALRISKGRFDLLGLRDLDFGQPPDWHLEPLSNVRAPSEHWSLISYLDPSQTGDKKIIWELNRHQYFATLGRAYWLTGDESFVQTFALHVTNWMDANPPKQGINWASSLEVSFRSISWIWALYFFKDSVSLTPSLFLRILKHLYIHGRHVETYLSTYFSPNTHLTGEALGLFYLGTLFPEFRCAQRWRTRGEEILLEELDRHVRPDGVYFEQSSYYHRYTADFYTQFRILLEQNNATISLQLNHKLEALLDHLMYITRPDGTSPLFGDDDGGRLVMLDEQRANDFRATLATGAVLCNRPDYKFVARQATEETLWLLGAEGIKAFEAMEPEEPKRQSYAFPHGGYYVMRDGWSEQSNYLLFDCGPHGSINHAHSHADALAFELAAGGRSLLVDPGTFTYTGSKEMRDWFRSTKAHNSLTLDGESSSVSNGPFSWQSVAVSTVKEWISRSRFDYVAGEHNGFLRLPQPTVHQRSVLFLKHDYWIIRDLVLSEREHRADLWFHFEHQAKPLIEALENETVVLAEHHTTAGLDIATFGEKGNWRREDGWVSHCYGEREPARVYAFSALVNSHADLITFLLPQTSTGPRRAVREVETIGGKAFVVTQQSGIDIVLVRSAEAGDRVEMERIGSNFEWSWVRFLNIGDSLPAEIVLLNGSMLEIEGRKILELHKSVKYLVARRLEDRFRVETEAGIVELEFPLADLTTRLGS
jgi:hypothetical protein